jgi:sarcosine oxidase
VIVFGLGVMGSAALYHLAKRGVRVCGIERFGLAHDRGSSHGETRIFRKAYFEHPDYIPLLERSETLWRELEAESGHALFSQCGLLVAGAPESFVIQGLETCYAEHALPHERFTAPEARERYPMMAFPDGHAAFLDPAGGYLRIEPSIEQLVARAEDAGADVALHETVLAWRQDGDSIAVETDKREFRADKLVLTAGPWAAEALAEVQAPLQIRRKALLWYDADDRTPYTEENMPCFAFDTAAGFFYGFPAMGEFGLKVAEHSGGTEIDDPDAIDRGLSPDDEADVRRFLGEAFPNFEASRSHFAVCMYTMTPDEHFVIDFHPDNDKIVLAAGFSGHGFKFAPVIGEIVADLSQSGETPHPIQFLRLARFT